MLQKIQLERFRGFQRLEIQIPNVLILMGPNSSGKTTALHAIRITCDAIAMVIENGSVFSVDSNTITFKDFVIRDIAQLMPITDWQALFVDQKVNESIHFLIQLDFDSKDYLQSITIEGKYARNENLKIAVSVVSEQIFQQQLFFKIDTVRSTSKANKILILESLKEHLPKAILIPPFYGVIRDEEYRARAVVDTLVGSADQSHVVRNMISRLTKDQFIQLNAFLSDMVGAELIHRTQGDDLEIVSPLRVTFKDSNGELELSAAGAGLINLVAIYSSLARWQAESAKRQVIFLLDEPEAHLHPKLQSLTANRLATMITRDFNAQLIMATHSVDIINTVGEREDCAVFRSDRLNKQTGGEELSGQSALLDDLSEWVDMTPFSAINFLASKRVLFYEGKSDGVILKKCADILYRNNPKKKSIFEKWTLVPLEGCGNEKIAQLLARLIESNVVPQKHNLAEFRVITQLDKDYHRDSVSLTQLPNKIPSHQNVWQRHSIESLFCESDTLHFWLKQKYPQIQVDMIQAAIEKANQDGELNQYAREHRQDALLKPLEKTNANVMTTNRQATQEVQDHPEIWQRGKDRSSFILAQLKTALGTSADNMTTALPKIIEKTDVNQFPAGNPAVIPHEISTLLDWMVTNA
jgi:predicted ATP-dependent endonuclease of OLD family